NCTAPRKPFRVYQSTCFPIRRAVPIHSFSYEPRSKHYNDRRGGCQVTAYTDDACWEGGYSLGDASESFGLCGMRAPDTFLPGGRRWGGGPYKSIAVTCGGTKPPGMYYLEGRYKLGLMNGAAKASAA
ncbi:hypothetical protein LTR53_017875, partial [Teratosphaeriaceae sp. CCFEE 6253]